MLRWLIASPTGLTEFSILQPPGGLAAVLVSVVFAGFFGVMDGVVQMTLGRVPMMARFFMVSSFVMLGGRTVVMRSLLVMF